VAQGFLAFSPKIEIVCESQQILKAFSSIVHETVPCALAKVSEIPSDLVHSKLVTQSTLTGGFSLLMVEGRGASSRLSDIGWNLCGE